MNVLLIYGGSVLAQFVMVLKTALFPDYVQILSTYECSIKIRRRSATRCFFLTEDKNTERFAFTCSENYMRGI